jgi:hypothetical protein
VEKIGKLYAGVYLSPYLETKTHKSERIMIAKKPYRQEVKEIKRRKLGLDTAHAKYTKKLNKTSREINKIFHEKHCLNP